MTGAPDHVYLTTEEFARRYRVKPRTAQRWREQGIGPDWVRLGGKNVLYRVADCEAWVEASKHKAIER